MKGDDLPCFASPCVKFAGDFGRAGNAAEEGRGAHCSPDLDAPANVRKIEKTVPKFDAGNVVTDENRTLSQLGQRHKQPSPERLETTEQLGIGAETASSGKPVTGLTKFVFDERLDCDAPVPDGDNDKLPGSVAA